VPAVGVPIAALLLGSLAVAALSLLLVAPAPTYDPWAWLLWGREIAGGELSTAEGPAFKPLPAFACALLSLLGSAAPTAWVLVARAGAVLAVLLAFRLGRRLAGGSLAAGLLAGLGVALCGAYLTFAATGLITGWLIALALVGAEAWRAGRLRLALLCGLGCGLLQVESWPFLLALGVVMWRRSPRDRPLLVAGAMALPALWLVPELLGSGDLLRSAERARVPNAGQPALAEVPALESLWEAAKLLLWPLWVGVLGLAVVAVRRGGAARAALVPAAVGVAWVGLVAAMAQAGGFSGEPRYALPGMALIAVSGAIGLATAGRATARRWNRLALLAVLGLVTVAMLPRLGGIVDLRSAQAYQRDLDADLAQAIDAAGGRAAILRCGRPYVGRLRGPLLAYRLDVEKRTIEPDPPPRQPGVAFRSRLATNAPITPAAPPTFRELARTDRWQLLAACRVRMP
jgi:hypothetical protein